MTNKGRYRAARAAKKSPIILTYETQVDKDGNGSISLSEYFGIFEEHGIVVNKTETNRLTPSSRTKEDIRLTQIAGSWHPREISPRKPHNLW